MSGPLFLTLHEAVRIHAALIDRYGGHAGIRDAGMLASAVEMPRASFDGQTLHADLFEMAAAYLFHIVGNHPFYDGNKRAGAACAIIFLELNGVIIDADEDGLYEVTMAAAQSLVTKEQIAAFFRYRVV